MNLSEQRMEIFGSCGVCSVRGVGWGVMVVIGGHIERQPTQRLSEAIDQILDSNRDYLRC